MVMDATRTYARPALHYNKGGEFGVIFNMPIYWNTVQVTWNY